MLPKIELVNGRKEECATMKNKKIFSLLTLSAIGVLGLTACDEIVAKPTDYDDKLIEVDNYSNDIYNNAISVVYDKIRDGNIGSDVLSELLYSYSISVFGYYNRYVSPAPASDVITLEEAVQDVTVIDDTYSGGDKAKSFIKTHKAYWTTNDDGKRINDANETVDDSADPSQSEYARLLAKWDAIEIRICENFYDTIAGSTYIDRNVFSEKKFLRGLISSLEDVANPDSSTFEGELYEDLLYPAFEKKDVFSILHREYYQSGDKYNYIEKKIIPIIYRQLLNEQYLLDETYNTLGRSYARSVNIIQIKDNANYPKASDYLINSLLNAINEEPDATSLEESTNIVTLDTFKTYSNMYVGVYDDLTDEQIDLFTNTELKEVFKLGIGDDGLQYFKGTEYGDLIEQYSRIDDNDLTTNSEAETTFTDTHKYTKETGLMLKTRELELKDYTTTGWYIKNGGLTDLPDSIRNRLFNIGVANGVPEFSTHLVGHTSYYTRDELDRWQYSEENGWEYAIPTDEKGEEIESAYVVRIKGKNYLKSSSAVEGSDIGRDILHYDSDSSTYYIVQIEEASSSSKLSKKGDNSYKVSRGAGDMESIVNEVTKIVGTSESYSTLATKHYLEKMDLEYHDDVIYDYFKENYPDLFE